MLNVCVKEEDAVLDAHVKKHRTEIRWLSSPYTKVARLQYDPADWTLMRV